MYQIPLRRQVRFRPSGSIETSPADFPVINPATRDTLPDQQAASPDDKALKVSQTVATPDPAASGQTNFAPDGWITRPVAQERLSLAGIELDSRRIRHLCARNQLECEKVKNEKNQPQHFINPLSLDQFIAKSRPADVSGTNPATPDVQPNQKVVHLDTMPNEPPQTVVESDPAPSGQTHAMPDQSAGLIPAGEWVPRSQLDQAMAEIDFMREEIRDARQLKRDLKAISSEMLDTFARVAQSNSKQLPPDEPATVRYAPNQAGSSRQVNMHDVREAG